MRSLSRPIRLLLIVAIALTLMLGATVVGVTLLLGSQTGTRFVADQVKSLAGDVVEWSQIRGTVLGPLHLKQFRLQLDDVDLSIADLSLDWQPMALLKGLVRIDQVAGSGIRLALTSTPDSADTGPFNPEDISLPVILELGEMSFNKLEIVQDEGPPTLVKRVVLGARLDGDRLDIRELAVRTPQGGFTLNATATLAALMPLQVQANWDWLLPVNGTSSDATQGQPQAAALTGDVALAGEVQWSELIGFDLQYQLSTDGLEAVDNSLPKPLAVTGNAIGSQDAAELQIQSITLAITNTPLSLALTGGIGAIDTADPSFALQLEWEGAGWPLRGDPADFMSPRGSARLEGVVSDYQLRVSAGLRGATIPDSHWSLVGKGDSSQLQIEQLDGKIIGGEVAINGDVRWDPAVQWSLGLSAVDLDPGQLQPDLSGILSMTLASEGVIGSDGVTDAKLHLHSLSGQLMDFPVQATASAALAGDAVRLDSVTVDSLGNTLNLSGDVSPAALAIHWQLDAPNPGDLLPGAGGTLAAQGTLTGSADQPELQLEFSGRELRLDNYTVRSLQGELSAGAGEKAPLALAIDISTLTENDNQLLASLQLRGAGTTGNHRIDAVLDTGNEQLSAGLAGGAQISPANWRGQLARLSLTSVQLGQWSMTEPVELSLATDQARLGELCLRALTDSGSLCATGGWTAEGAGDISGQLQSVPLAIFTPTISGDIDGQWNAKLAANGTIQLDSAFNLSAGNVSVDETRRLPHGGGELKLQIGTDGLAARLQLATPEQGKLDAVVELPALRSLPLANKQPLQGSVQATLPDLTGLAAWVPEVGRSAGRVEADLQLGGDLTSPSVEGMLALEDGAATLPLAGLELHDIHLRAASDPARPGMLRLTGGARSDPGQLSLEGETDLQATTMTLVLRGDRFKVYDTPDARALLSPDLQLAWQEETLKLRGQITIPQADITPKIRLSPDPATAAQQREDIPGQAVTPSRDVVVISENVAITNTEATPDAPFRIDSQVRVQMGDKVRVKAVGLVSGITGAVDFTNIPEQEAIMPLARGRFSMRDGTFRAFGQDLEIETGQLIFADVPANEPEINLRAVRWIDNDPQVTAAGVQVSGPLDQPMLELFSRPQLDTSEIQSYLLTGRSPRSRDNVLGIGTYVSRKVYVGYGYNMLEKTSEFNSLFNISPHIGAGSSVGEADNNINMTFTYEH